MARENKTAQVAHDIGAGETRVPTPLDAPVLFTGRDAAALIPVPDPQTNKYARGCLVVAGGCKAYQGAAVMASLAALNSGAGYVRLATPESAALAAQMHLFSVPVAACPEGEEGTFSRASHADFPQLCSKASALLMGCGMGNTADSAAFLWGVLEDETFAELPIVLDADALNIVAGDKERFAALAAGREFIFTPHEGEAARLLGRKVTDRAQDARALAREWHATVVLKGPGTLVATEDGMLRICTNAGPELAKAGTGDVLAGMIAAFAAQGLVPAGAASLGVWLHGRSGALSAQEKSALGVTPKDIIEHIGAAICSLQGINYALTQAQQDIDRRCVSLD